MSKDNPNGIKVVLIDFDETIAMESTLNECSNWSTQGLFTSEKIIKLKEKLKELFIIKDESNATKNEIINFDFFKLVIQKAINCGIKIAIASHNDAIINIFDNILEINNLNGLIGKIEIIDIPVDSDEMYQDIEGYSNKTSYIKKAMHMSKIVDYTSVVMIDDQQNIIDAAIKMGTHGILATKDGQHWQDLDDLLTLDITPIGESSLNHATDSPM